MIGKISPNRSLGRPPSRPHIAVIFWLKCQALLVGLLPDATMSTELAGEECGGFNGGKEL